MGHFTPPAQRRYALRNAHAPACLVPDAAGPGSPELTNVDVLIADSRIEAVEPAGTLAAELGPDLDPSLVLPGMVDCHTHLDKGHIWPRSPNPTGEFPAAVAATAEDRESRWSAETSGDGWRLGLMTAYAHGVVAIRTHLDSLGPQAAISFPVFRAMRESWAGRIDLQASSNIPIDCSSPTRAQLADIVAASGASSAASHVFAVCRTCRYRLSLIRR